MAIPVARLAKLLIFYSIFYAVLAGFSAAMFAVFLRTLDDRQPKWQQDNSLIGSSPGLGVVPRASLIMYNSSDISIAKLWIEQLDEFLAPYIEKSENVQNCDYREAPDEGKVCDFKIDVKLAPCLSVYSYGFESTGPCVFLKLNKIYGWIPEYYDSDSVPLHAPEDLKTTIKAAEARRQHKKVWVSCEAEDASQAQDLGTVQYFPEEGFNVKYFPYTNLPGYMSPLVAVHFASPKRGVLFKIECKAWAYNIKHSRKDNRGLVRFELLIH
jgi:sodium/potassium-transporting ATPase subunit beta